MKGFSMTMEELLTGENLKVFDMVDVLECFTEQFWPQTRNHSIVEGFNYLIYEGVTISSLYIEASVLRVFVGLRISLGNDPMTFEICI